MDEYSYEIRPRFSGSGTDGSSLDEAYGIIRKYVEDGEPYEELLAIADTATLAEAIVEMLRRTT